MIEFIPHCWNILDLNFDAHLIKYWDWNYSSNSVECNTSIN